MLGDDEGEGRERVREIREREEEIGLWGKGV